MLFPGASKTFTVKRKTTVKQGNNTVNAGFQSVATGVPVNLKALNELMAASEAGLIGDGVYVGGAPRGSNIMLGDLLSDETENGKDGSPVQYEVQGCDTNFAYVELRLKRTSA